MKQMMIIETYSQLKAVSDPLRAEMIMRLLERPYTGQQLSEIFKLSRARIHYHLKELEKNGLIEIVHTEEKNGIMQKFYQSVARGFTPSADLLPHKEEISESTRQVLMAMMERTKSRILSAPEQAFESRHSSEDPSEWGFVSSSWEITAKEEDFQNWIKKYFEIMYELSSMSKQAEEDPDAKLYYFHSAAFEIDESLFGKRLDGEKKE